MAGKTTIGQIIGPSGTYPLLGQAPIAWQFTEGVQPSTGIFEMPPDYAKRLVNKSSKEPVVLEFEANKVVVRVRELWVEGTRPGPHKYISAVMLSDRRRFLKYGAVAGRYNIPREIGVKRVRNNAELTLQAVIPQVWYAAYSLKNPSAYPADPKNKWQYLEMLEDVYGQAMEIEKLHTGTPVPALAVRAEIQALNPNIPIETLTILGQADTGLAQAYGQCPEAGFTVDAAGLYIVYSRVNGAEAATVKALGPEVAHKGHVEVISNRNMRSGKIEVYWPIESEVRFDALEPDDGATQTDVVDQRLMQNIIPTPDFQLPTTGDSIYVTGSPVPLLTILGLWGTPPGIGGSSLTLATIRKAIPGYIDLLGPLLLAGNADPDHDWGSRLAALRSHFRLTYKLPPRWLDRWVSFKPYRVGIADNFTQQRASSEVWADFYMVGCSRSFFKNRKQGQPLAYITNVRNFLPTDPSVPWSSAAKRLTSRNRVAPFQLSILNPDLGIIHLTSRADMARIYENVGMGRVITSGAPEARDQEPSADFARMDKHPVTFDMVESVDQVPTLDNSSPPFQVTVIVTATPASPNNLRQFYKITVEPKDVKEFFPAAAQVWLDDSVGPTYRVMVNPGLEGGRAMIRWHDDRWQDIEKLFGVLEGEPNLEGLVVNRNTTTVSKDLLAPNLDNISRALAARVWARYGDRMQGGMEGHLNAQAVLDGWAASVGHHIDGRGVATTSISLPDALPFFDFVTLLDGATQAILKRQPQANK